MEENSDVHMETDVSSTTDDVVDTQEVTGSNGQVEMTITVEKVDEGEATSNVENDVLIEGGNKVSSGTTAGEKSPLKEPQSQTIARKSLNKSTEVSKPVQMPLAKTESPLRVTSIVTQLKNTVNMSSIEPEAESADSSTKIDSLTSPNKDKSGSMEKITNVDHDLTPSTSAEHSIKSFVIFKKSPANEISNELSCTKDSEVQKLSTSQTLKSPGKEKSVEKSPVKKTEEQDRTFQVIQSNRSPSIKSPPIKLIRKPNKEFNLHDSTVKELKLHDTTIKATLLQDSSKPSTSKNKPTITTTETTKINGDTTSPKPSQKEELTQEPQSLPCTDVPMDIVEAEASNDSQLSSTASEKDHNKSISRELRSLINSAKESKIISECTQLTSKTRKSRTNLDTSLNASVESEIIPEDRRDSYASDFDKPLLKRSMRSQNPDFVTKCKQFLSSVTSKVMKDSDETQSDSEPEVNKEPTNSTESSPKKKKVEDIVVEINKSNKLRSDPYCWRCHWQLETEPNEKQPVHPPLHCTVCVRSYHSKCMTVVERKVSPDKNWVCPDCLQILHAESSETRSPAMKKISLGMLCDLLKFALERMEALNGVEPFLLPVDRTEFPNYDKVIVHPMDLLQMRQNITDGHYGSTEAFIADAQWILHNSILFNACEQTFITRMNAGLTVVNDHFAAQSKLTAAARALVRTCRAEMAEIETCPECYAGAHSRNLTYFTEVCSTPHMILWAKLKGFPYWPAKAVAINNGMVDVRFFGQHDKSWVPVKDCYLYSEKDPNTTKHKRQELMLCRQEAEIHIRNICRKYGSFVYAPFKTTFDHTKMTEQLKMMIPSFDGEIKTSNNKNASPVAKDKRRSTSKSSKSSFNDGDISECDESSTKPSSSLEKPGDNEDASKEVTKNEQELDTSVEKNKTIEVEVFLTKRPETPSRKRRRSTIPEPSPVVESTAQKKKKIDEKSEDTKPSSSKEDKKPEPGSNKQDKSDNVKSSEAEVEEITNKADKSKVTVKGTEKVQKEQDKPISLNEQEILRVTPIKLVALPRANKQTPKIFTTAKVTKSTPSTPTTPMTPSTPVEEEKSLNTSSSSKRSKASKADRFIMTEQKDLKPRNSRRNSRSNKSLTSTPKQEKTDKKSEDNKKSDSGSDASTSKERPAKKKDDSDRSLLRKDIDSPKTVKDEKETKKRTDDNLSLGTIAWENKNTNTNTSVSLTGLPTISNVVSLSTTAEKTSNTNTQTTSTKNTGKSIEKTIEANSDSSIFTPTSTSNVGNMKEAVSKLQKLRNETVTEPFVGRVGVKAFARMRSPDINDDVQVEVKAEPIDLDEIDENRQIEKMDLMNACKLQPVNQPQSLRDVRINKLVITPSVMVKKPTKVPESRPRAKKTFPQPKRPEGGSELNGKNSMVYIPIQPPMTQPPLKPMKTNQHGITMAASVSAGPRPSTSVISTNSLVNTVTTPLRPIASTLSSPPPQLNPSTSVANTNAVTVAQVSTINQAPTVGPTTVHTVPLMTSVNGQWMFSLQPVMSVGGVDNSSSPPRVNGITERPGTTLVPISSSTAVPNATVLPLTPVTNRHQQNAHSSPAMSDSNGTPLEMPRLLQRPLMSPFDVNTPIGNLPPPSTAGPLTAKLNQNAVKLTDFFRTLLEDSIEKLDEPLAQVTALKIQLEQARWRHQQNLDEVKHNHELTLSEMRQSFEKEKMRVVSETRRAAQVELEAAVKLTKSKQWCSNCHQEAHFYCCWNTSYCDYTCQRAHWNTHFSQCTQEKSIRQLLQEKQTDQLEPNNDRSVSKTLTTTHLIGQDGQPSSSHSNIPELSSREQQTSTNRTIIELGEQRPSDQQTPTNKTIIELGEQRSRDQQPSSSQNDIPEMLSREQQPSQNNIPEMRSREQPPLKFKTIIDLSEHRSREQQTLLSPKNKVIVDNAEQRVRALLNTQREDNVQAQREKLQIILNNAKQRDELRRQQLLQDYNAQQETGSSKQKDATESRLQQGDNPPRSVPTQTPCLTTIGGKPAPPMRVFTDPTGTQKTSIIVSMIEDTSGNQTLKCVGTYKAPAQAQAQAATQISPLLINQKQTSDDSGAAKKTVTSGGYLIVGASGNTTSVITPAAARRPHVQYYS